MNYMNRYFVRPSGQKIGRFAVYRNIGVNRAEEVFNGSQEECNVALYNLRNFYKEVSLYIEKHGALDNGHGTYLVSADKGEDAMDKPFIYETDIDYDSDYEEFIDHLFSVLKADGLDPCEEGVHLSYIIYMHGLEKDGHGRYYFIPTVGDSYKNVSGSTYYRCLQNFDGFSVLQSDAGWTFKAYGIVIDDAGFIEWSSSTNGRFEKLGAMTELQKQLIYDEMRLTVAMAECRKRVGDCLENPEEELIREMAKGFLANHDSGVSDDEQWEEIISSHIKGTSSENKSATPCDIPGDDGVFRCPYEGMGSESDRCRVYCGLGVDE